MCPVSAIRVYLQSLRSAGFAASAPLLTCTNGHFVVMSDIASAIKASAVALGQDPSLYSTGHSVRAGGLHECDVYRKCGDAGHYATWKVVLDRVSALFSTLVGPNQPGVGST